MAVPGDSGSAADGTEGAGIEGGSLVLTTLEIEELLERREGRDLDFKEGQYAFAGADDNAKGELLKDILAFANTPRMHDAYILIGVREVKDGTSEGVGVAEHLDDASLQQFVNSKTNRKVRFCYEATPFRDVVLGVIRIDRDQERPVYLAKPFGRNAPHAVFMRSGSSTAIATPDDISAIVTAQTKAPPRQPALQVSTTSA